MLYKIFFFLIALLPGSLFAAHVAVLETISPQGVLDVSDRQYLTDELRAQAVRALPAELNFTIMTRENIIAMLPPGKSIEQCEGSCLVETGKNISADYVAQGRVGKFGNKLTLTVELYETAGAKLVGSFTSESGDADGLLASVREKAPGLFAKARGAGGGFAVQSGIGNVSGGGAFSIGANRQFIVKIQTTPAGAALSVDGRPEPKCRETPCNVQVSEGEHRFLVALDYYDDMDTVFTVSQNGLILNLALPATFGTLIFQSPLENGIGLLEDLHVDIDGNPSAVDSVRLSPGEHTVRLSHPCYEPLNFMVGVLKGRTDFFDQKMKPKMGSLELSAVIDDDPQIVPVWVNGVMVGETPWNGFVPVCATIALGERKQKVKVKIEAGVVTHHEEKLDVLRDFDGNTYHTAIIGNRTWMAENLNYKVRDSWCYDNDENNCKKYGRLYTWKSAMKACPVGWRLPTGKEWDALADDVGGGDRAGVKLKSRNGWIKNGNGMNDYDFSALPAGYRDKQGLFYSIGKLTYFWSASKYKESNAYAWLLDYHYTYMYRNNYDKTYAFSVRCVKD